MPSRDIPDKFRNRPFPVAEARAAGMSRRMLRGTRFRVVTRGVYATTTVPESYATFVRATLLTLPVATIATGVTGLRLYGSWSELNFPSGLRPRILIRSDDNACR
jgi:hypothetical protein